MGERLARWLRQDIYKQQSYPLGPEPVTNPNRIQVTVDGTTVTLVVSYSVTDANAGLYTLPSPDCSSCCQGGAGVLLVNVSSSGSNSSSANGTSPFLGQYRPPVVVNASTHTLTATLTGVPAAALEQGTVSVGLMAEEWPQCVLYNRHGLPALPWTTAVQLDAAPPKDEEGTSLYIYVAAVLVLLAVVGAAAWLIGRYLRSKRTSGGDEQQSSYSAVDDKGTRLLNDDE